MGLMADPTSGAQLILTPHPVTLDGQKHIAAALEPGEKLGPFLRRTVPDWHADAWEVRINGVVVPVEVLDRVRPKDTTLIEVRGVVRKQALYIVAMAVLAYFTMGAGLAAYGAAVGVTSAVGLAVLGAVTFVAGAALINKVLGPKPPSAGSAQQNDPVYSINSARNAPRPYEPLPFLLGSVRITPDLASMPYVTYEGNNQYLGMVLTPGINVHSLEALYNGDTPLASFEGVQTWLNGFGGHPDQSIPLFTNADSLAGGELQAGGPWIERTGSPDTVQLQLDFEGLLYDVDSKGKFNGNHVTIQIQWRETGTTTWTGSQALTIHNRDSNTVRRTVSINVDRGQYDVRVQMGQPYWHDGTPYDECRFNWTVLKSIQADETDYTGIPRIGIRIKATGQLNGALDEVRMVAHSAPVPLWTGTGWVTQHTSNPGAHLLAYARGFRDTNGRLLAGIGLPDSQIDIPALQAFMVHCAENDYTYDAYIKDGRNHQEMVDAIALAGFGQTSWAGGKFSVVWASADQPLTGVVNMATIKKGSFQVDYTLANAADGVEYTYVDRATWTTATLRVPAPGVETMQNPARITGEGVTSEEHAARAARYHLAQSLYQAKDISYGTDLEHLTYRRMSLLALSHDMTQWGYGGRLRGAVLDGSTLTVTLDAEVPFLSTPYIGLRVPGEGAYRVLPVQPFSGESDTLTLAEAWPEEVPAPGEGEGNPAHDTIWIYDIKATPGYRVRVVQIEPESDLQGAGVVVVPEGPEFWHYVHTGEYIPPANQSLLQGRPIASDLIVTEHQVVQGDTVFTELGVAFSISGKMSHATVALSQWLLDGWSEPEQVAETRTTFARFRIPEAGVYTITVRPYGEDGVIGVPATVQYATEGADIPPPAFDSFNVQALPGGVRKYTWGYALGTVQAPDFAGAEIRYIAGTVAEPVWEDMTPVGDTGFHTAAFEAVVPAAGIWTFAARARNTAGELSAAVVITRTLPANLGEVIDEVEQTLDEVTEAQVEAQQAIDQEIADRVADTLAAATALAAEVAARTAAIAAEALARADAIGAETLARADADAQLAADLLAEATARGTAITNVLNLVESETEALAQQIAMVSAGTSDTFDTAGIWHFGSSAEGWTGGPSNPTVEDGWLRPATGSNPYVVTPNGLGIEGESYKFARLRIRRVGAPTWEGRCWWRRDGDSTSWATAQTEGRYADIPEPTFDDEGVATVNWRDLGWGTATIAQLRFDLSTSTTSSDYFLIDWAAVGRPSPGASTAALQEERTARITAMSAEATARETLATQLRGNYTGTDINAVATGLIYSERQARSSADAANANALSVEVTARTTLQAAIENPTTGLAATRARLITEEGVRADADSALATRTTALESTVNHATTGLPATRARLITEEQTRADADSALASRATALESTVNHATTGLPATRARLITEETTRATADSALAGDIAVLQAQAGSATSSIVSLQQASASVLANFPTVPNPSFEEDFGWSGDSTPGSGTPLHAETGRVTTSPHTGNRCLRFGGTGGIVTGNRSVYTDALIPVRAGAQIRLIFWSRITQGPPGTALLRGYLRWHTGTTYNAQALAVSRPTSNHSWARNVSDWITVPDGTDGVMITLNVSAAQEPMYAYVDDVAIEVLSAQEEATAAAVTAISNTLNDPVSGLASRASQSALTSLSGTVGTQGDAIYSNSQALIALNATVGGHSASLTQLAEVQASAVDGVLIMDPSFEARNGWGDAAGSPVLPTNVNYSTASPMPGNGYSLRFNSTTGSTVAYNRAYSRCVEGQAYRFRWYSRSTASAGGNIRFYIVWYDEARVELGNTYIHTMASANHDWTERSATWTAPAGAAHFRVAVGVQGGSSPGNVYFDNISGELMGSDVVALRARHTVALNVNGHVSGTVNENDGATSSFSILATVFRVISTVTGMGMEWQNGYLRIWKGAAQLIIGHTFGVGGDLVFWYGPNVGAANCTKANARIWFDTSGDAYFGGTLSAGTLKNAAQSTQVSGTAQVETGPFSSNGNTRTVVVSLTYNHSGAQASVPWGGGTNGVAQATSATVTVQRSVGGGSWTTIGSFVATGERMWTIVGGLYEFSMAVGGSLTHSDTSGGTSQINYRAVISSPVNWPAASSGQQRLSVISTEEP